MSFYVHYLKFAQFETKFTYKINNSFW